jgi:hypothetical protein
MPTRLLDHLMPTASAIVSRGWVIKNVEAVAGIDEATRSAWIDELCAYEPVHTHGPRNNALFWMSALGGAMLSDALGLPGWTGFVVVLVVFTGLARALATRTLLWRLARLQEQRDEQPGAQPVTPPA